MTTKKTSGGGKTVTRTSTARKTIVRKDEKAAPAPASVKGAQRPATGRPARVRAARPTPTPKAEPTDEKVHDTVAQAQADQAAAATTDVSDVIVDAQAQTEAVKQDAVTLLKAAGPQTREQLTAAREEVRGKYAAVKGLPQYATEEARYQAQLEALEQSLSECA